MGEVQYHRGWKNTIRIDHGGIRKIALSAKDDSEGNWSIFLEMYPGNTVEQARSLYSKININKFENIIRNSFWRVHLTLYFRI